MRYLLFAFTITVGLVIGSCSTNPSTGRSQLLLVSDEEVAAMGEEAKPQLIQEFGGEVKSRELRSYVASVGQRLLQHVEPEYEEINWEFVTLDSDVLNAFALPGGKVFVSRGMLQALNNEAQLAAVLAHEIGHVTAKHVDERLTQQMAAQFGMELLGQGSESQIINAGAGLLAQGTLLHFNRDQELESDRQGLKYMVAAGYDPRGMLDVQRILLEASQGGRPPEFLSTHPDPERRLEQAQNLIEREYRQAVNSAKYDTFESRFQRRAMPHLR